MIDERLQVQGVRATPAMGGIMNGIPKTINGFTTAELVEELKGRADTVQCILCREGETIEIGVRDYPCSYETFDGPATVLVVTGEVKR